MIAITCLPNVLISRNLKKNAIESKPRHYCKTDKNRYSTRYWVVFILREKISMDSEISLHIFLLAYFNYYELSFLMRPQY